MCSQLHPHQAARARDEPRYPPCVFGGRAHRRSARPPCYRIGLEYRSQGYSRAMSTDNVELVRAYIEAIAERGFDAAGELIDRDFEMSQLPLHPEAGTYRGPEAIESMQAWVGSFEEFHWEADEYIDAGDQVVVVIGESGRARGSGVEVDQRFGTVYTLRDGKITRLQ